MGYTLIAPVGDNPDALFVGMKEFPIERAILITPSAFESTALDLKKQLEKFTIETKIKFVKGNIMEEMFRLFGEFSTHYNIDDLVINVSTGDRMSTCAALSASFANGLKAIGVEGGSVILMPIMRISYYKELSDRKMDILKSLDEDEWTSLQALSKRLNLSSALVSYHLNGNYKYPGLKQHRLVELKEKQQHLLIRISKMGSLLLKGHLQ